MTPRTLCPKCSSFVIQESVIDSVSQESTYFHYKCVNKKCKLRYTIEEPRKGRKTREWRKEKE